MNLICTFVPQGQRKTSAYIPSYYTCNIHTYFKIRIRSPGAAQSLGGAAQILRHAPRKGRGQTGAAAHHAAQRAQSAACREYN